MGEVMESFTARTKPVEGTGHGKGQLSGQCLSWNQRTEIVTWAHGWNCPFVISSLCGAQYPEHVTSCGLKLNVWLQNLA